MSEPPSTHADWNAAGDGNETAPMLSIQPDYLARLIVKVRGVQARAGEVDPDTGSNPIDDKMVDAVQDGRGDLSREEIREELQGLDAEQQAELVALMWTGRGDAEPEERGATVALARGSRSSRHRTICRSIPWLLSNGPKVSPGSA